MDTIKFNKRNTKVIAHRGLSGIELENTCSAFVAAGNRSYYGIETDVHKTRDGKYVVIHDNTTKRVSNVDVPVWESTCEELQSVVLNDVDGTSVRNDLRVPLLEDYIKICHKYDKVAVLELKCNFEKKDLEDIIKIISDAGHLEKTIFISFILEDLVLLRELLPNQAAQYLTGEITDEIVETLVKYNLGLDVYYTRLNPDTVKLLKDKGIVINCYTCDKPEHGEKLAEYGIEYITSNILE